MVLRETAFKVGGGLSVALGLLLGAFLYYAGAGFDYFSAWLAAGLAVGLGGFFAYVGWAEGAERRRSLRRLEGGSETPVRRPPS